MSSNFKGKSSNKFPLLATAEERWKVGLERIIEKFEKVKVTQSCLALCDPMDYTVSRPEYWSG